MLLKFAPTPWLIRLQPSATSTVTIGKFFHCFLTNHIIHSVLFSLVSCYPLCPAIPYVLLSLNSLPPPPAVVAPPDLYSVCTTTIPCNKRNKYIVPDVHSEMHETFLILSKCHQDFSFPGIHNNNNEYLYSAPSLRSS